MSLKETNCPLVGGHLGGPASPDRRKVLTGERTSLVERNPEGLELLPGPADPNSQDEAATAESVEVGGHARRLERVSVGEDRDCGPKLDPPCDGGEPSECDERIIERRWILGLDIRSDGHMI